MMRKLLMLLLMIVAPVVCFAQSTLHFTYDDAGNRTSRTIIINNRQFNIFDLTGTIFGGTLGYLYIFF